MNTCGTFLTGVLMVDPDIKIIISLATFQALHWFDPAQSFYYDYVLEHYNITSNYLITQVYSLDVGFQVLAAALSMFIFIIFGYRFALLFCSIFTIASTGIVLVTDTTVFLILSQFFWAVGFTAIFLILASYLTLLPRELYLRAASINSFSSLFAEMLASLIGFVITKVNTQDTHRTGVFYGTLVSSILSFLLLILFWAIGWIPASTCDQYKRKRMEDFKISNYFLELLENLKQFEFTVYLILSGVIRGAHSEMMTLWQGLSRDIDPSPDSQTYNGIIGLSMAAFACCIVFLPPYFNAKKVSKYGPVFSVITFILVPAFLILSSIASNLYLLGAWLTLYYGTAELFFVIAATRMAHAIVTSKDDPVFESQYLTAMGLRFLFGLAIQSVVQLTIFPSWGVLSNIFGLKLSLEKQFQAIAYLVLIFSPIALWASIKGVCSPKPNEQEIEYLPVN